MSDTEKKGDFHGNDVSVMEAEAMALRDARANQHWFPRFYVCFQCLLMLCPGGAAH